ncbi:MAG: hypothetical protein LBE18_03935, partial [Planctomycetaceae bacterium]|nr:hypothetical protein [Planctomycetaceae bacterium]
MKTNFLFSIMTFFFLFNLTALAQESAGTIDAVTLEKWSSPYRGWHYYPDPIIPSDYKIPDAPGFKNY